MATGPPWQERRSQDTRKPLVDWFRAMYWVTTQKSGASALGLQRVPSAAQEDGPGIGRIRLRRIAVASAESLMPFVKDVTADLDTCR